MTELTELRTNKPKTRLRDFPVGEKVILIGADIYFRPYFIGVTELFIGKIEGEYWSLWASKKSFDSGSLPLFVAAGSHEVSE